MTDIREGLAKIHRGWAPDSVSNTTEPDSEDYVYADNAIQYLRSQGVVQKVEGELPVTEIFFPHHVTEECCKTIMEYMVKKGYTLTKEI